MSPKALAMPVLTLHPNQPAPPSPGALRYPGAAESGDREPGHWRGWAARRTGFAPSSTLRSQDHLRNNQMDAWKGRPRLKRYQLTGHPEGDGPLRETRDTI